MNSTIYEETKAAQQVVTWRGKCEVFIRRARIWAMIVIPPTAAKKTI